jgi:hypothetical protein
MVNRVFFDHKVISLSLFNPPLLPTLYRNTKEVRHYFQLQSNLTHTDKCVKPWGEVRSSYFHQMLFSFIWYLVWIYLSITQLIFLDWEENRLQRIWRSIKSGTNLEIHRHNLKIGARICDLNQFALTTSLIPNNFRWFF